MTLQRSILSPLLCNILLHELDIALDKYCKDNSNFNTKAKKLTEEYSGSLRYKDTVWAGVWNKTRELAHTDVSGNRLKAVLSTIQQKEVAIRGVRFCQVDSGKEKIQYVKYADDFVPKFVGDKKYTYKTLTYIG